MECKNCKYYDSVKCTDSEEFVNADTGFPICRYNSNAIKLSEYLEG